MSRVASGTAAGPRQSLPSRLTSFIGREHELTKLENLSRSCRLLTLTGPGGSGKTRLALELVDRIGSRYPDGVYVASLAPVADPDHVASTIAVALGAREATGAPILQTLAHAIGARQILLLLDNLEHLI